MNQPDEANPPSVLDIFVRAAIQASPRLVGSMTVLYEGFRDRATSRTSDMIEEMDARVPLAVLAERTSQSEELDTLLLSALQSASQSALRSKRRLLGRLVAQAVLDDALVDESRILAGVLDQLDAPHVRCLEGVRRAMQATVDAGEREPVARGAEQPTNARVTDTLSKYPPLVIHQLITLGLLDSYISWDGLILAKGLTVSGDQLLSDLHDAGEEPDS